MSDARTMKKPLIKAVQELHEMVEKLESELAELKSQNAVLQGKTPYNSFQKAELFQNAPNPFNTTTTIRYQLPLSVNQAFLNVYDMNGKQIKSFKVNTGQGQIRFEPQALAAGMYIYTLIADGKEIATKRMILTQD